ncbi:protein EURL homolog [Xenopus tropicalis]|uniref:LOC100170454 protein n=1 Tax=Xenopus tropicalis TaxID=8364 RepID=B3DL45_XENTR|nr:protein EURL homolog [Xenopus tropicalis]AAI67307.1 LOC100170454 protein [Xenopus tropicalis]|eukprot:NP_001123703.1 protein EURL homolog [Xenopus tropicalis]
MIEEEQFVNIDLNDDNVCSICKLGTDIETLSFCHICFELSIEGVPRSDLLHTRSLRGHKDCFEKFHLIANQDCPRSKHSKSPYEEVKNIVSKKINWIVQYAQNKDLYADSECPKSTQHKLRKFRHQSDRTLLPQNDSQVPRYSAKWLEASACGVSSCAQGILEQSKSRDFSASMLQNGNTTFCHSNTLWPGTIKPQKTENISLSSGSRRYQHYSREQLSLMSVEELGHVKENLLRQIKDVFEDLSAVVQDKDSLSSELHVRHIAIEQLLKNCSKLPCLQMGRAGLKANFPINN